MPATPVHQACFFNEIIKKEYTERNPLKVFESVYQVIADRREHPKEGSYTNYLFDKGIDKIFKESRRGSDGDRDRCQEPGQRRSQV